MKQVKIFLFFSITTFEIWKSFVNRPIDWFSLAPCFTNSKEEFRFRPRKKTKTTKNIFHHFRSSALHECKATRSNALKEDVLWRNTKNGTLRFLQPTQSWRWREKDWSCRRAPTWKRIIKRMDELQALIASFSLLWAFPEQSDVCSRFQFHQNKRTTARNARVINL